MSKVIPDSLYYSLQSVCHQMAELDNENTSLTIEESPCVENVNTERSERLWHKPKGSSLKDMEDRRSDFDYLFSNVFREVSVDAYDPLPVRELSEAVLRYMEHDKRAKDIHTKYNLGKAMSLGYRAWVLYVITRSVAIIVKDGNRLICGIVPFDATKSS